jgi:hypothetical protein
MAAGRLEAAVLAEALAELRHLRATQTAEFAKLQSNIVNDTLSSGLVQFDAGGQATESFRVPYGSVAIANHGSGTVVLTNCAPTGATAPSKGKGVRRIASGAFAVCNLAGVAYGLYGTAGEMCSVEVFTRPQPPVASGALAAAALLGAAGDGLGVAMTSPPPPASFNDVSAAGATATRTRNAVAGQRHRLVAVSCSYSAAASTGTGLLTVTDGATVIAGWDVPLAVNTPFTPPAPPGGWVGSTNTALVILLAAGAAGTVGRLSTSTLTTT